MLALAKTVEGGISAPPITLEPGARVFDPQPLEEIRLVGMGLSAIQLFSDVYDCQFDEPGKRETWTFNHGAFLLQHSVCHNMGDLTDPMRLAGPGISFIDLYRNHDKPLVTTRFIKEIKNCYEYPWELVFGYWNDYYFQSGPALTLALAMISLDRYQKKTGKKPLIRLYGLDYNYPGKTDYEEGRCCIEYWVGRAKQAGFRILVPAVSALLDQSSYSAGNKVGLHGNGFCYGLGKARPIFGMNAEEGTMWLKSWRQDDDGPTGVEPVIDTSGDRAFPEPL